MLLQKLLISKQENFVHLYPKRKILRSHPSYIYGIDVLIQWEVYITTKLKEVENMGKSKGKSLMLKPMFCAENMGGGGKGQKLHGNELIKR